MSVAPCLLYAIFSILPEVEMISHASISTLEHSKSAQAIEERAQKKKLSMRPLTGHSVHGSPASAARAARADPYARFFLHRPE